MRSDDEVANTSVLPVGFDDFEPGPELAARLANLPSGEVSGHDRVLIMRAHQKMVSHYQAKVYSDMAAIWELEKDFSLEDDFAVAVNEIRAALHLTRRAAEIELGFAIDLCDRIPRVHEELGRGQIDIRRAKVFVYATGHVTDFVAQLVTNQVIGDARGLTGGQLLALIRRICFKVDPEEAKKRFEDAIADRRVVTESDPEGTAQLLGLNLPPERVEAAMNFVNALAQTLKTNGEERSLDQLRADVLLDLLAGHPFNTGIRGKGMVDITIDLPTLVGLNEDPAELGGFGPVIADIARQVARAQEESQWRFRATDPETGRVVAEGITRRRPTARQRRQVESRDRRCVFPGCRMPARKSDLDHQKPYAEGGETDAENLAPDCRHDHVVRHMAGWEFERLPDGDYLWTSPFGLTYTTSGRPPPAAA